MYLKSGGNLSPAGLLDILYLKSGGDLSPAELLDILYLKSGGDLSPAGLLDILYLKSGGDLSPAGLLDILYLKSGGDVSPAGLLDILYLKSGGDLSPAGLLDILYLGREGNLDRSQGAAPPISAIPSVWPKKWVPAGMSIVWPAGHERPGGCRPPAPAPAQDRAKAGPHQRQARGSPPPQRGASRLQTTSSSWMWPRSAWVKLA